MEQIIRTRIKQKRDTHENWISTNPILLDGEIAIVDTEDGKVRQKIGDGANNYASLPFLYSQIDDKIEEIETNLSNHISDTQTQLNNKVPTSRTINGKALSSNVSLVASDINADSAGSAASALAQAKAYIDEKINGIDILNKVFQVGCLYISAVSTSPASLFGGTWQQIQGRFLLAAGGGYSAGATGGAATHTLTEAELPSHTHIQLGVEGGPDNSSPIYQDFQIDGNVVVYDSTGDHIWATMQFSSAEKTYRATRINMDGETGATGDGSPHNNMPPYLAVYVWKRTA